MQTSLLYLLFVRSWFTPWLVRFNQEIASYFFALLCLIGSDKIQLETSASVQRKQETLPQLVFSSEPIDLAALLLSNAGKVGYSV